MKRFNMESCVLGGSMEANEYGDFVYYDDAQATIARLTAELAEARAKIAVMMPPQARYPDASGALADHDKRVREGETRACIEANRAAREVVIHSGQVAFIDGVREGHNRADRALTARLDQSKAESGE